MKGVVLAAGYGSRLKPLSLLRAKPAVPLHNQPLVCHSVEMLKKAGVDGVAVNLHHLPDTVRECLSGYDDIVFSYEPRILGRGGALKKLQDYLGDDTFVVSNGKIYLEQDLKEVVADHRTRDALVTLLCVDWTPASPFNPVLLDPAGRIVGFDRSRGGDWDEELKPAVFTGVHVLEPAILERLPDGPSDTVGDLYPRLISEGARVRAFLSPAFWCESSTLERYLANSIELLGRRRLQGLSSSGAVWPGTVVGAGCRTDPGAEIVDSILWEDVEVQAGASLQRVIVTKGSIVADGIAASDAVITPRLPALVEAAGPEVSVLDNLLIWPIEKP